MKTGEYEAENGVDDGIRTRDILSHSQTLHQLSYIHHKKTVIYYTCVSEKSKRNIIIFSTDSPQK